MFVIRLKVNKKICKIALIHGENFLVKFFKFGKFWHFGILLEGSFSSENIEPTSFKIKNAIIRNHIKSRHSRLQSSISNLHDEDLKSHEITLKSYEHDFNHMKLTEIPQNYVQS